MKVGGASGTLKTPLAPEGKPDTVNETCELKPLRPTTFTLYEADLPTGDTVRDDGLTLI
ncbi:MAG TPA: hypothetical protein VMU35_06890 [Methylomirabilota bacterium]|nr:hypothetical protein [Methylomirabilota bacterium]